MIVNITAEALEVISHYAHGLQSGQIAMQLKEELKPPFWVETLTAIIEHDDEQLNFERNNNLTGLGLPSDFTLIKSKDADVLERCRRIMEQCRHRSGWVTILVSMHLEFIYADLIVQSADFKAFMMEIKQIRKK